MSHASLRSAVGAALFLAFGSVAAVAAPGDLDGNFGTQGVALLALGDHGVTAMALQSDQKILAATLGDSGSDRTTLRVSRFTTSGGIDSTFGNAGTASVNLAVTAMTTLHAMLRQSNDSRLVLGGRSIDSFAVTRLTTAGALDTGFGTGGTANTKVLGKDEVFALAQQTDNKIVAVGRADDGSDADFAIVRYTTAGIPDTTFSGDGIQTVDFGGEDVARAVAVQTDGSIVVAGVTTGSYGNIAIARLTSNGTLDPSFGTGGKVTTSVTAGSDAAWAVLVQSDFKIVVAGEADGDFVLVRYSSTGQPDSGFGSAGIARTNVSAGAYDSARALVRQSDDKLLAAGIANPSGASDFALVRYTSGGLPDATFSGDGIVTTSVSAAFAETLTSLLLQADGKALAAGLSEDGSTNYQMVARYQTGVGASLCGNGAVDSGEQCDLGAANGTSGACCTAGCLFASAATVCRSAAGACDIAESCTGSSSACPANSLATTATTCRAAAGVCDVAEKCSGASATCPADAFATTATTCRSANGVCDVAEKCSGASATCPADAFATTATTCRSANGVCDVAETCSGSAASCPANSFATTATTCRAAAGVCDAAEKCSGSASTCPADVPAGAGTTCTDDGNPCTDNECDGAGSCVASNNTLPCDDGDECTLTDLCSGGVCSGSGSVCGNGSTEASCGESCDDGNVSDADACLTSCVPASCGDQHVRVGVEGCDDGNTTDGDGCSSTCLLESCGNGTPEGAEECDDGNSSNTDGCLNTCASASCGDAFVHDGVEQCDDGNDDNTDACIDTCENAVCGDGHVRSGLEVCDDGNTAGGDACSADCKKAIECGDADLSGKIVASDALRVLQAAVGQPVSCPTWLCDVNSNGSVQAGDALSVLRTAVGQPVVLHCPPLT